MDNLMIYFIFLLFLLSVSVNIVLYFYIKKLIKLVFKFEDELEKSIRILDDSYDSISNILSINVFSDDLPTRTVIAAIKNSRNSLLGIINKLTEIKMDDDNEEE